MSYPASSEVSPGQPTASAHYNTLRNDALFLGAEQANAVTLGAFLSRYEDGLTLELLDTDRVRVPASLEKPVCLMVSGYMLKVSAHVDLPTGSKPGGVAAQYYVFAQRSGSSTAFTLTVNTSSSEGLDQRRIGGFYWDGSKIENESLYTELREILLENLNMQGRQVFGGRLTLESGDPAPENAASGGTIYYTPYTSSLVSLYGHGMGWKEYTFTELSVSLSGLTSSRPADIFIYDDSGTLKLEAVGWTSASARAVALTTQDGIYVKSGAINRVYLGTVGITATPGVSEDDNDERLVWNMYNRLWRPMRKEEGTSSWSYTTPSWRAATGSDNCRVEFVIGVAREALLMHAALLMSTTTTSAYAGVGIGLDTTTTNSALIRANAANSTLAPGIAVYTGLPAAGQHTISLLERGNTGYTFYGSFSQEALRAGLVGGMLM